MKLYRYQHVGAAFLAERAQAFLADDMGLGKSAQAITAADFVHARRVLVVCPAVARINWAREFDKFSMLSRPVVILDTAKTPLPKSAVDLVAIMSYEQATNREKELANQSWDVLIVDEAHFLKSRDAKRTKAIYGHGKRQPGIISSCRRCWRLSGTPMPANPSELWTHAKSMGITDASYWDWTAHFCSGWDNGFGFQITGARNTTELKALLKPVLLRRKPEDPDVEVELPFLTYSNMVVPASQVKLEDHFMDEAIKRFGVADPLGELKATLKQQENLIGAGMTSARAGTKSTSGDDKVVSLLSALSTSAAMLRRYIGIAKAPAIAATLAEELETKAVDKVVVFAWHTDVIHILTKTLMKFGAVVLDGHTTPNRRQACIDAFQNDPATRVFIGQITACGTAINLTASNQVVFAEQSWTPADNAQALKRCHRIGQQKRVYVRAFSLANSIDERVDEVLTRKTKTIFSVMG